MFFLALFRKVPFQAGFSGSQGKKLAQGTCCVKVRGCTRHKSIHLSHPCQQRNFVIYFHHVVGEYLPWLYPTMVASALMTCVGYNRYTNLSTMPFKYGPVGAGDFDSTGAKQSWSQRGQKQNIYCWSTEMTTRAFMNELDTIPHKSRNRTCC